MRYFTRLGGTTSPNFLDTNCGHEHKRLAPAEVCTGYPGQEWHPSDLVGEYAKVQGAHTSLRNHEIKPRYTHTFHYWASDLFRYRDVEQWVSDMGDITGHELDASTLGCGRDEVMVRGTAAGLQMILVALNMHAEQSPSDGTPVIEAERFEQTVGWT